MKQDLTWLKILIQNYKQEQDIHIRSVIDPNVKCYYSAKFVAAEEILLRVKIFIKEANELTTKS